MGTAFLFRSTQQAVRHRKGGTPARFSLALLVFLALAAPLASAQGPHARFSNLTSFPLAVEICEPEPCRAGGMQPNQIALTFDDGPGRATFRILDSLNSYGIQATFFVHVGLTRYSQNAMVRTALEAMSRTGHKVANHGRAHAPLHQPTSLDTVVRYLVDTDLIIEAYLLPEDIRLYRNPGGYWSSARANALNAEPQLSRYVGPIFWNVGGEVLRSGGRLIDAADWSCRSNGLNATACAQGYYNAIQRNYESGRGSVVLMHDTVALTARLLPELLAMLEASPIEWEFILVQDIPAVQDYAER